jgi:hypothetical protein
MEKVCVSRSEKAAERRRHDHGSHSVRIRESRNREKR